jgi:hypothetical protein
VGLNQFPGYRAGRFDPNSAAAQAIEAANFPPDLVENRTSLWTLNRFALWEVAECLFVRGVDPGFREEFPGFAAFADYDFTTRPESVGRAIRKFENSGEITKPLISVHVTLDAFIPLKGHARPYKVKIEAQGFGANYRLYEIQNGNHLDSFNGLSQSRHHGVNKPVTVSPIGVAGPVSALFACPSAHLTRVVSQSPVHPLLTAPVAAAMAGRETTAPRAASRRDP